MIRKEFLVGELKYRYPELQVQVVRPLESVGRPLFFEPSERRVSPRVYVAGGGQLPEPGLKGDGAALFLSIGTPNPSASPALDYCVFPPETDGNALLNFVQRLFDRLDEWSRRLKQIAESGEDCSALLEEAATMLQNPVWLSDERGHIVARAERYFPENAAALQAPSYNLMEIPTDAAADGAAFHADDGETALLCAKISAGGARFTLVLAARERPFYGSDESVFENLTGYVKLMLSERRISARALRPNRDNDEAERMFRALLDGGALDGTATETLERLGWTQSGNSVVLAAETQGDFRGPAVNALCDHLEEAFPGCCAFGRPPVIAAVLHVSGAEEETKRELDAFCESRDLSIGISTMLEGYTLLPERLKQAAFALGKAGAHERRAIPFVEAADAFITAAATKELPAELVCARSVWEMAAYDREHGTNYLETAQRYVKNRYNAVKTAGDLFIHRSTFLYRLERIQSQFGLDLEAEQISPLQMLLSFRLADEAAGELYERREEPGE